MKKEKNRKNINIIFIDTLKKPSIQEYQRIEKCCGDNLSALDSIFKKYSKNYLTRNNVLKMADEIYNKIHTIFMYSHSGINNINVYLIITEKRYDFEKKYKKCFAVVAFDKQYVNDNDIVEQIMQEITIITAYNYLSNKRKRSYYVK